MHVVKLHNSFVVNSLRLTDDEGNEKEIFAIQKLFDNVAPRYAERQGGYTRIMKMGPRRGDGAPVVVIELV